MDINFVVAQGFGVLSMVASICSMQFKKRRAILIALFCLNLFAALNMIFLESWAAAYISGFAIFEMIVNYLFERRKKAVPVGIVAFYILGIVAIGVLTYEQPIDILAIMAAIVFCFTILAKKEQSIRKLMFLNQLLWLVFDTYVGAYALAGSNVLTLISTTIAYVRYRKTKKKVNKKRSKKRKRVI